MNDIEMLSSFLAGVFITKKEIDYKELSFLMSDFSMKYNVYIDEEDSKLYLLDNFIYFDSKKVYIKKEYDDCVILDNKTINFEKLLYRLASERVKDYFNISIKHSKHLIRKTKVS